MTKKLQILIVCLFLTAATLAAFWQVTRCDFITFDDIPYITRNTNIQQGVTIKGITWAFTTGYEANWHPLTWISHMLDIDLYGLQPGGHHFTSLLFHIANALVLFFVLLRMTKALWQSAVVAALFALHPLRVESVAWLAERKDVLSAFFWMLTMGGYIYYRERPGINRYLMALLFYALGLMAKPMLVTLPFVLILLDYWPLRRFTLDKPAQQIKSASANIKKARSGRKYAVEGAAPAAQRAGGHNLWELIGPLLVEKIPFFILAGLSSIVTHIVQQKGGMMQYSKEFPLGMRSANALVSYVMYMVKMLWPTNLAVLYPYPESLPSLEALGAALLLIAITLTVVRLAKRFPYLPVGWLWYAGTLVPVIGIVQVGAQSRADRYTYIPMIGLFIMAAWGIPELIKKWRYRKEALIAASTSALVCLFIATWIQVGYWRNSMTLFDYTLNVTDRNAIIYQLRAWTDSQLGDYTRAIADYDKAIEFNPTYSIAYDGRGSAYSILGNYTRAIADYDNAIEINPRCSTAYSGRGVCYCLLGNYTKAIADCDRAIEINPKYANAYKNRGDAYFPANYTRAIADYDKAIELDPKYADAYKNRGDAYGSLGKYTQAIADYDMAIKLDPGNAIVYNNRKDALRDKMGHP